MDDKFGFIAKNTPPKHVASVKNIMYIDRLLKMLFWGGGPNS